MINRRQLLQYTTALLATKGLGAHALSMGKNTSHQFFFPDESHAHQQTWMAFVANDYVWSSRQIPQNFSAIT